VNDHGDPPNIEFEIGGGLIADYRIGHLRDYYHVHILSKIAIADYIGYLLHEHPRKWGDQKNKMLWDFRVVRCPFYRLRL